MNEMSLSRLAATDLVSAYDRSLEQQISGRGSNLVCRDEELWKQVEGLLRDGDAQDTHCLGLDPLRVMEESLKAAATAANTGRHKASGGLQGLAKAFEIMEQAALNLYIGPWREEYKVIKMYSGMFTHYIKPVLSMPQTEKLFGLLGYQPSSPRYEQLRLQSPRVSSASQDNLLCLSCAFFLARCECRVLLLALGKHAGEAQWELSLVKERQRGNSLQVALDNTQRMLEVEMDLYTDGQVNGGQRGTIVDDESPRSLTWVIQNTASPPVVKTHSNGVTCLSSSSNSVSAREDIHISTFNHQLNKASPVQSDLVRSSSVSMKQGKRPCDEAMFDKMDTQSRSLRGEVMGLCKKEAEADQFCQSEAEANNLCSCLKSRHVCLNLCNKCNALHDITCAYFKHCCDESHPLVFSDRMTEVLEESRAVSLQSEGHRASGMSASPTGSNSTAMSSLVLCDDPKLNPFAYHDCCNLTQLDPRVLCFSCGVFHSRSCRDIDLCQNDHKIKQLGVCSCRRTCSRKPLVLCRYCGNEYCTDCWYRNPVVCSCGQTFDQSSSV